MAKKGQSVYNSKTGEKITWLATAADTGGQELLFDFEVSPGGKLPVMHFHPGQTETFTVKQGRFIIKLKDKLVTLDPGDSFTIDKGVRHQWWNESGSESACMEVSFKPALNTEIFLEQFYGLGNAGKTKQDGTPSFLQIMAMVNEYQLYIDGPPLGIQIWMGRIIGGLARLIGYKKFYPEYSRP